MTRTDTPSEDLAARVAARVCHDIMSPVSAIKAGFSFLGDTETPGSRAEARDVIGAGLRGLEERMALYRLALGRGETPQATDVLGTLAAAQFADLRPSLDWSVTSPSLPGTAARAALHMVIILGESLASGGEARISTEATGGAIVLTGRAMGPRVRLHPEARDGLLGHPCPEGPGGRWAFAAFLRAQVDSAGGEIAVDATDEGVSVVVTVPHSQS